MTRRWKPEGRGQYTANAGTFVYVAYDINNKVLYVGITDDLFGRMASHRQSSAWWQRMERLTWEEWSNRDVARMLERELIGRYCPEYNVVGNPKALKK